MSLIKNQTYTMTVCDMGSNGEGIAKVDGFVVLVPGALPEEEIAARIIKVNSKYAVGKLEKVLKASSMRVEPQCSVSKQCGGCTLQHLSYLGQRRFKTKRVEDCIRRIGGFDGFEMHQCVGMDNPCHYRNKAQFPVGFVNDRVALGMYAPRSHRLVAVKNCLISAQVSEKIIDIINQFLNEFNIQPYDENNATGLVRHVLIRTSSLGQIMVGVVINGDDLPRHNILIERLTAVEGMASIILNINKKKNNTILGDVCRTIWGKDTIDEVVCGVKVSVSPLSFLQVNHQQAQKLYNLAVDAAQLSDEDVVIDAYCGIGIMTQLFANKCRHACGIEYVQQAIDDACVSAKENGVENIEFHAGDCAELLPQLASKLNPSVIVLDPPRKGCDEAVLEAIGEARPKRIVYVSCDPATLARDLKIMAQYGYELKDVWAVDMFPNTAHVETVALLSREKADDYVRISVHTKDLKPRTN